MRAGRGSSDAYLADWKRSPPRPCGEDIAAEVAAEAARIEAQYTDERLERMVKSKGVDPDAAPDGAASTEPAGA